MTKILKPFTIIPVDLYVQRDADRQLRNIIKDMGRPGYVLVSRQMGKTNLLLNAKRKLETPGDAYVYIDLSNPFDSAKKCFENIIDTANELYIDKFSEEAELIKVQRSKNSEIPIHKQHINELRLLLNAIPGKLVIILDEIDALTKTTYSDQIFAQIRSTYFSRINYSEFERLTYILSGVIEPNEIIKDPKISPFNIGQKIFLNDFSKEEFYHFLKNSNLNLTQEITDKIYSWTSGNPRITWDVCSEIENISKKQEITCEMIDELIKKMYLSTYDKPPIDNIRELVRAERELRNAIIEIGYNKGNTLSDMIKSKLYLAGIINYNQNDVQIKNEIIKRALNQKWLRSLEEEDRGLLRLAIEYFDNRKYLDSLNYFEKYLHENEFPEINSALLNYYVGYAAYRMEEFNKALAYLEKSNFDIEEDSKSYFRVLHLKGLVFYYLEFIEESLACFKQIIDTGKKDELFARALLNFGSISLESEKQFHRDDAIRIFNSIIDGAIDIKKINPELLQELKSIAYFNLAQIFKMKNETDNATKYLREAQLICQENMKPKIILSLYELSENKQEKENLIVYLLDLIISKKITPNNIDPENPIDFNYDELKDIIIIAYINYKSILFEKIKLVLPGLSDKSMYNNLYDLALHSIYKNEDSRSAIQILKSIYESTKSEVNNESNDIMYKTVRLLAYYNDSKEDLSIPLEYMDYFNKGQLENVSYIDMEIFANLIYALTLKKKYNKALEYVNLINSVKKNVSENNLINYLMIYHLELNLYYYLNLREKAISKAQEIIQLANDEKVKNQTSNLLGDTGLEIIKSNAETILNPAIRQITPIKAGRNYGRNETVKVRYKDGTIIEAKFKKIENDLKLGNCFIFN